MRARFIPRREMRKINAMLDEVYGASFDMDAYVFFYARDRDLHILSREVADLPIDGIVETGAGLYVGEVLDFTVRLSVEGSQIIGPHASRRVVELPDDAWAGWLRKEDVEAQGEEGFVIVRHGDDFLGSGLLKAGKLVNYLPKGRSTPDPH